VGNKKKDDPDVVKCLHPHPILCYILKYKLSFNGHFIMAAISVRLPDQLESRLTSEAAIEGKGRSEVARDAIADYLARREHERFMAEMVAHHRCAAMLKPVGAARYE